MFPLSIVVYVDGSSRGNPGPAGIGVVVLASADQEEPLAEFSRFIGTTTNNVAEYEALIFALKWLVDARVESAVIRLDSELVYKQIYGEYRIRTRHIVNLLARAKTLMDQVKNVSLELIDREKNKLANRLAQKASKIPKTDKKDTSSPLSPSPEGTPVIEE